MIHIPSSRQLPWLLAILFAFTTSVGLAQDKGGDKDKQDKPKSEAYTVVMVDASVKVLKKSDLKAERTRIDQEYKDAVKSHQAAAAEARKAKQKFNTPKPKKAKFKVLGNFKSEEEAQKYVSSMGDKDKKKASGKERSKGK